MKRQSQEEVKSLHQYNDEIERKQEEINKKRLENYTLITNNNKSANKIYYNSASKTYLKFFVKELSADHSDFLYSLLNIPWFRKKFTPHLLELIVVDDEAQLRLAGYIMMEGITLTHQELLKYSRDLKVQNLWKRSMHKYKFHYNDFKTNNLIKTWRKDRSILIGLIDLEAIRPIATTERRKDYSKKTKSNVARKIELFDLGWYYDHLNQIQKTI